ncbi:MAG: TolC family protein, partial [Gallionella sp.]|nr:TolC family protein [Gallionella sp.]
MKIRFFVRLAVCGLMGAWPAHAAGDGMLGSNLPGLLAYAREHNPELAATRFEAEAAVQRVQSAAALSDPVMRAELMDITNQGTNKSASLLPSQVGSTRYTLIQSVPWYGKRDLKREAAEAGADQARGQTAATWAELSAQIKSTYAQYYYVAGSQKITRDLFDLVMQMEKVAQVRYANGLAAQQDAVRAQVEQTVRKTELVALNNTQRQVEARLNTLLSRPATMPLAAPQHLRSIPATASLANYTALENRIREHNPELFMDEAGVRAGEKNRDLVYRNRYPDVALGISPTQSGNAVREWGVMVEFNIP